MLGKSVQAAAVFFMSMLLTWLTDRHGYRTPLNAIWMFGVPVMIGFVANNGWQTKWIMAASLFVASTAAVMLAGILFGSC